MKPLDARLLQGSWFSVMQKDFSYSGEVISRQQALDEGLKKYFTGKPCRKGHISQRTTCDRKCVFCVKLWNESNKEKCNGYYKKWRDANPEKTKKQREDFRAKNPTYMKKWNEKNKERISIKLKEWRSNNLEKCKKLSKEYYKENKERLRPLRKKWRQNNKSKIKLYAAKKNSIRRSADGKFCIGDILKLYNYQKMKCAGCLSCIKDKYHVDHIIPLARGGTNWPENIQLLCPSCNMQKHAKDPIDWAQENGRLL